MKKTDVQSYFGSYEAVAQVLEISRSAVSQWPSVIPQGAAWKLQFITGGRLRVDTSLYVRRTRVKRAEVSAS